MCAGKIDVVCIVAALLPGFGIGCKGGLPWRLSKEMKYFRQVTSGTFDKSKKNAVIMGRKTWESIPPKFRPLPNRVNVVISRSFTSTLTRKTMDQEGKAYYEINDLKGAINELRNTMSEELERIYIIGGGQIYSQSLDVSDKLLITKLEIESEELETPEMDTFLQETEINKSFKECNDKLQGYLPAETELPEPTAEGDFINHEKGYKYQYTLYTKSGN